MASQKKRTTKKPPAKSVAAMAIHLKAKDGENHVVGIGNLRVVIVPDGPFWFAQGLEIDYAVQGNTIEDAKKQFEDGLESTIEEHLRQHGNIRMLLNVAPNQVWNELLHDPSAKLTRYWQLSDHHIIKEATNFDGLEYLVASNVVSASL